SCAIFLMAKNGSVIPPNANGKPSVRSSLYNNFPTSSNASLDWKRSLASSPRLLLSKRLSPNCPKTQHNFFGKLRHGGVQSPRELREMSGRHTREQVMFGMIEHRIGEKVQPSPALCAAWLAGGTSVVDSPDSEESGQTFAREHRSDMPAQSSAVSQ